MLCEREIESESRNSNNNTENRAEKWHFDVACFGRKWSVPYVAINDSEICWWCKIIQWVCCASGGQLLDQAFVKYAEIFINYIEGSKHSTKWNEKSFAASLSHSLIHLITMEKKLHVRVCGISKMSLFYCRADCKCDNLTERLQLNVTMEATVGHTASVELPQTPFVRANCSTLMVGRYI